MKKLKWLWEAFEGWPPLRGVRHEIRTRLHSEYALVEPFLHRTGQRSETFPCPAPGGAGCPRRVVTGSSGNPQAVCGSAPKECETVEITEDDLIVYELDWMKFCRFLANNLHLAGTPSQLHGRFRAWDLGYEQGGDVRRPVFFFTHDNGASLQSTVDHLHSAFGPGWTALTSRRHLVSATMDDLLAAWDCLLLGLEDSVKVDADGQLYVLDTLLSPNRIAAEVPCPQNVFRREGTVWALTFDGRTVHVGDITGMGYIADLLRHPRSAIEAAVFGVPIQSYSGMPVGTDDERITKATALMPGIPMADAKAIKTVKVALAERLAQLTRAPKGSSELRTELEDEISKLRNYLSGVKGHRGKARISGGVAQRARSRVKHSIDRAREKITKQHPSLGRHLKDSIKTGTSIIYLPTEVPDWIF
jgi:hypothetical protein